MAERPVFTAEARVPYYHTANVEFAWNGGFAKVQKQKNITALHEAFQREYPECSVLEISSKSMQENGEALSAFFLKKYVRHLDRSVPVECIFQSSKVFGKGGPYEELLTASPREAKKDERLRSSGSLVCFRFEGREYPLIPRTAFYDWIYMNALLENEELMETLLQYDAFTDIEFNPEKSLNCQAKAAAAFVGICRNGQMEKIRDFDSFLSLYKNGSGSNLQTFPSVISKAPVKSPAAVSVKDPGRETKPVWTPGMRIKHPAYGEGMIEAADSKTVSIRFETGIRKLGSAWCEQHCEILP